MTNSALKIILLLLFTNVNAQENAISIELNQDTIFIKNRTVEMDVLVNNKNEKLKYIYFFKDACCNIKNSSADTLFSKGLTYRIYKGDSIFYCTNDKLKKRKLNNPTLNRMEKLNKKEKKKKQKGSIFCRKKKETINFGKNRRTISIELCEDIPPGEYRIRLFYHYYRDKSIDYSCIKCYPRIRSRDKVFEGSFKSNFITVIKTNK